MCQTLAGVGMGGSGNQYQGGYHFFAAFQIAAFCDEEEFLDNMDDALAHLAPARNLHQDTTVFSTLVLSKAKRPNNA